MKNMFRYRGNFLKAFSAVIATFPVAVAAESRLVLYHELDGAGNVIRSIALDSGMLEPLSVVVAVLVFCLIVRFVIGD